MRNLLVSMCLLCYRWTECRVTLYIEWGEGPTVAGWGLRSLCHHKSSVVSKAPDFRGNGKIMINSISVSALLCFSFSIFKEIGGDFSR